MLGTANTALEYHDGRLLALVENDFPYHIQMPKLDTVGRYNYQGALQHSFTGTLHYIERPILNRFLPVPLLFCLPHSKPTPRLMRRLES